MSQSNDDDEWQTEALVLIAEQEREIEEEHRQICESMDAEILIKQQEELCKNEQFWKRYSELWESQPKQIDEEWQRQRQLDLIEYEREEMEEQLYHNELYAYSATLDKPTLERHVESWATSAKQTEIKFDEVKNDIYNDAMWLSKL
jgi:hypothetical protein